MVPGVWWSVWAKNLLQSTSAFLWLFCTASFPLPVILPSCLLRQLARRCKFSNPWLTALQAVGFPGGANRRQAKQYNLPDCSSAVNQSRLSSNLSEGPKPSQMRTFPKRQKWLMKRIRGTHRWPWVMTFIRLQLPFGPAVGERLCR